MNTHTEGLLQDGLGGPLVCDDGLELGVLALALLGSLVIIIIMIIFIIIITMFVIMFIIIIIIIISSSSSRSYV